MTNDRRPDGLAQKALAAIRRERLLAPGDTVLVALSGGADSMALLHVLLALRVPLKLAGIEAAHVHHGLRGEEADRDERFVREACRNLSVPLSVLHADVRAQAKQNGQGLEEAGRHIRYAYFAELAAKSGAVVATAHTLSDQMETVLLHLARGCGLRGLCGIPAQRPLPLAGAAGDGPPEALLIRPLIDCTRSEIEEYCTRQGIAFVTDSTNREDSYARNRIRSRVVPELERLNPGLPAAFARMTRRVREDADYLEGQASEALCAARREDGRGGYDRSRLRGLPAALRSRALRKLAGPAGPGLSEAQVEAMEHCLQASGAVSLPGGLQFRAERERAWIQPADAVKSGMLPAEIRVQPGISFAFYGRITMPKLLPLEEYEKESTIHKNLLKYALNYDKISGYAAVRSRQPGDFFHPAGRGVGKTLKKLFNEAGVPAQERERIPVLCDRQGIVLVGGFGCDERVRITPDTRQVLVLKPLEAE